MGTPFVGDVLLVENLNPSGFPKPTIVYQWLRDDVNISGANGATYEVVTEDTGSFISLSITITNIYGQSTKILTTGSNSEGPLELPSFYTQPSLFSSSEPPLVGSAVSIQNLNFGGNPEPTVEYSWYSGSTLINGETGDTYYPRPTDVGNTLSSIITLSNIAGTAQTTVSLENSVVDADLQFTFARINRPVLVGSNPTLTTDIERATGIDYFWYYRERGTFEQFSGIESPLIESSLSGREIKAKLIAYGFSGGETTDIERETPLVTVTESSSAPSGSYPPQGTLIPGSGFVDSFVEKGTTLIQNNVDLFASESYPVFRLGEPDVTYMSDSGMTLDMYAFHGSGVKSVTLSCNGSTSVTAGFEQEYSGTGDGYFYFNIDSSNFTSGQTYEVRATATPFNGYSRSQQMILTYYGEENKVQIDTSGSIKAACLQITNAEDYDPTKKNIVELTESGYYDLGSDVSGAFPTDYGIIEVIPADGVLPKFDLTNQSSNSQGITRPSIKQIKFNNCQFENKIGDITQNPNNSNPGIYIEDTSVFRWYADGCTFEGDWFTSGNSSLNCDQVDEYGLRTEGWWRNSYYQRLYYTNCYARETHNAPYNGAELAKNCTVEYCHQDAYTNTVCAVNCKSLKHLTPSCSNFHADHYQLFNSVPPYLVENKILYGYYGEDLQGIMQSFGFFGAGVETYNDIAIVGSSWTGGESPAQTSSQLGLTYSHLILSGLTLDSRSIVFRDRPGNAVGPVLVRDINCASLSNAFLHPLDVLELQGTTNEFRVINTDPEMVFGAAPTDDSALTLRYEWHIAGASMASVDNSRNFHIGEPDGTNTNFLTGITAGGPSGPAKISDILYLSDFTSAGLGRWAQFNTDGGPTISALVMYGVNSREEAEILDLQDYYLRFQTSKGSMTSTSFRVRDDSTVCDFLGFGMRAFSGVTMSWSDIIDSSTGVTFQLFQVGSIGDIEPAFWLTAPEASTINPIPGATLGISGGVYSGIPEPTFTYTWSQRGEGQSFYSTITGVTGATLDLSVNGFSSDTEIKLDIDIQNIHGSDVVTVEYGSIKDWDSDNDGIFLFPAGMDNSYKDVTIVTQPSSFFSGITQASLIDSEDEEGRLKFESNIQGPFYIGVWDGSSWSVYKTGNAFSVEQRYSNYAGPGGQPSAQEVFTLYQNDPGDPGQFDSYIADWDTFKDGVYRFPSVLDNTPRNVTILESASVLAGVTKAFIDS